MVTLGFFASADVGGICGLLLAGVKGSWRLVSAITFSNLSSLGASRAKAPTAGVCSDAPVTRCEPIHGRSSSESIPRTVTGSSVLRNHGAVLLNLIFVDETQQKLSSI
jgi:hypothetical protein